MSAVRGAERVAQEVRRHGKGALHNDLTTTQCRSDAGVNIKGSGVRTAVKKEKAVSKEFVSPFDAPDDDDRYFVEHYKDEKPAVDGVKRWNPHQFPPRPPG